MALNSSTSTVDTSSSNIEIPVAKQALIRNVTPQPRPVNTLKAALLTITGAFMYCLYFASFKLCYSLNPGDLTVIRFTVQGVLFFVICKWKHLNVLGDKKQRKYLSLFGFLSTMILCLNAISFQLIAVSDVITTTHSAIIFTAILCRIFLKEKLTCVNMIAFVLTATGVVFMTRPTFLFKQFSGSASKRDYNQYIGIGLCLVCAIMFSLMNLTLRKLSAMKAHYGEINMFPAYFGIPMGIAYSALLVFTGNSHQKYNEERALLLLHIGYSVIAALIGVIGISLVNLAFSYEDAAKVVIMKTTDVLFSFVIQYLVLNVKPNFMGITGAVLILSSTTILILSKIFEKRLKKASFLRWLVHGF